MNSRLLFTVSCFCISTLLLSACATEPHTASAVSGGHDNLNSTLWVQTSAEYKANSVQTYRAALRELDTALANTQWTAMLEQGTDYAALPPAIVLDVDETVLDNSPYQAQLVRSNSGYQSATWDHWISLKQAAAVPGVVDFIVEAKHRGVEVIYLTNRACRIRPGTAEVCPQEQETIDNLTAVGLPGVSADTLMLRSEKPSWTSEKQSRREELASQYRVVMLFGDNLGDFLPHIDDLSVEERDQLTEHYLAYWGSKWFVLSNPTYGSWMSALDDPKRDQLTGY